MIYQKKSHKERNYLLHGSVCMDNIILPFTRGFQNLGKFNIFNKKQRFKVDTGGFEFTCCAVSLLISTNFPLAQDPFQIFFGKAQL